MKGLEDLRKELEEVLKKEDIILSDLYIEKKGKYTFLTVELDKTLGIDLDTIVDATHIINPIVDKYENLFDKSFVLDVVSKERGN